MTAAPIATGVLVSGEGTNLQAVMDAVARGELPLTLRLVIANNPAAFALERARRSGLPTATMPFDPQSESRSAYATRLADALCAAGVELVLLLGWMHVLAPEFFSAGFKGVLNLHPGYLPDDPSADVVTLPDGSSSPVFRGPRALRDALRAGATVTGATLIEVTPLVDRGPVLARRQFALRPDDSESSARARIHPVEHDVVRTGIMEWLRRR